MISLLISLLTLLFLPVIIFLYICAYGNSVSVNWKKYLQIISFCSAPERDNRATRSLHMKQKRGGGLRRGRKKKQINQKEHALWSNQEEINNCRSLNDFFKYLWIVFLEMYNLTKFWLFSQQQEKTICYKARPTDKF